MDLNTHFQNKWTKKFGIVYIIASTIIFAIVNFYFYGKSVGVGLIPFILLSLYAPALLYLKYEKWNHEDFGVVLNLRMIIITLILAIPMVVSYSKEISKSLDILSIIIRFGEELFYRGFLFQYFFMIFRNKRYPVIRTILLSSLCFALVHTQTFLPTNNLTMIDIFISAVGFATIRYYTKSILTPVVLHCISDGGVFGGILGAVIYFIIYGLRNYIKVDNQSTL